MQNPEQGATGGKSPVRPESSSEKIEKLYELIEGMDTAMMTTRRPDGHLVSRPMGNQARAAGADLWFVTSTDTTKVDEIRQEPHVNVTYYDGKSREWISISGLARVSTDSETIRTLYRKDWSLWFPDEGGEKNGGPGDPRIVLIGIEAHSVVYMTSEKPGPLALFEIARAKLTGTQPRLGTMHGIAPEELEELGEPRRT